MNISRYSFEEYVDMVKSFHESVAPGMIIGGFMVDLALNNTPEGELTPSAKLQTVFPMRYSFSHRVLQETAGSRSSIWVVLP